MAAQKGGQLALLVGLVLCFFIILALVFVSYRMNGELDGKDVRIRELESDKKAAEESEQKARKAVLDLAEVVHGSRDIVDVDIFQNTYLEPAQARLKAIIEQEAFGSEEFAKKLHEKRKLEDKPYRDLTSLYQDLFAQIDATVPELNRLRAAKDESEKALEQARKSARDEKKSLDEQIDTARQKYGQLENEKIEAAKEADSEKRRLLEEKDQVLQEMETLREEKFIEIARLESNINKLKERIRQMDEKKRKSLADTEADGEIVHAAQDLGLAWIDLGRQHRLRRGLTFEVFQYVKGGTRKTKGFIEVKRVEEDTAQVAVLKQLDPADPIVKGDLVASPLYDKKKDMVFVFVGDSLTNDRYEKSQLERRIRDFGGRVDPAVTIETDFVIAIKDAEQKDEFEKAVQFGVVILREQDLLDFIGQ